MKKFARKSLFFTLFFALFFFSINFFYLGILVYTDWGFMKRLESLKFDNPDFELLVLGTSFAEYGIDTELLSSKGMKSYNLALAGNSFKTSYIQLNEYLTKYSKRPKYVLLVFNSYSEPFDKIIIQPTVEFTMEDYHYGLKDAPILKFKWLGTEMIKKILSSKHRKAKLSYGQVKFKKCNHDNTEFNDIYLNKQKIESTSWIGEIAKLCNQNGIELIMIEIPGFKETQNLSEIGPHTLHFNNGCSAPLYNFNSKDFCVIFDKDKDWVGNSHLNEFGARKFTQELITVIQKSSTNAH